eukprot:2811721-Rhodomonas_salina.1
MKKCTRGHARASTRQKTRDAEEEARQSGEEGERRAGREERRKRGEEEERRGGRGEERRGERERGEKRGERGKRELRIGRARGLVKALEGRASASSYVQGACGVEPSAVCTGRGACMHHVEQRAGCIGSGKQDVALSNALEILASASSPLLAHISLRPMSHLPAPQQRRDERREEMEQMRDERREQRDES